jgi:hypothetical protein
MNRGASLGVLLSAGITAAGWAQTPQPFPRPGDPARPQPPASTPSKPADKTPKVLPPEPSAPPSPGPPASGPQAPAGEPTEQTLGLPIYPGAQFIGSYDAGRGQRYYLYGASTDFAQVVGSYRTALKQRGELVFEIPQIHMFEVGRFREETMVFPPGVTVKDYAPEGYMSFKAKTPVRFQTVIQFVPGPPAGPVK